MVLTKDTLASYSKRGGLKICLAVKKNVDKKRRVEFILLREILRGFEFVFQLKSPGGHKMNPTTCKILAASIVAFTPVAASADSIAASLSASFGEASSVTIDVGNDAIEMATPTSVAVAASAGLYAAAGSVANGTSAGAVAGAAADGALTPVIGVNNVDGSYETSVYFVEPGTLAAIAALESDLATLTAAVTEVQGKVDAICSAQGSGTVTLPTGDFVTGLTSETVNIVTGISFSFPNLTVNTGDVLTSVTPETASFGDGVVTINCNVG